MEINKSKLLNNSFKQSSGREKQQGEDVAAPQFAQEAVVPRLGASARRELRRGLEALL